MLLGQSSPRPIPSRHVSPKYTTIWETRLYWLKIHTALIRQKLRSEFGPGQLANLDLGVNQDIKSRVTYSVITKRLNPDDMRSFLIRELDRAGLGHNTFTQPAVDLIVRSADGVLRKARNLCVSCLIEAVRSANRTIDIDNVNRILMQPHWQKEADLGDY
jgi:MSHA biogenesis protein MshM